MTIISNTTRFKASVCFLMFLVFSVAAAKPDRDGMIPVKQFEISPPASGTYAPWREQKESSRWYAGELITINDSSFRYRRFSDVIDPERPEPDFSGKLSIFKDHIYLDHPGIAYPYRVSGLADGVAVLLTWEGYEHWKKTKKIFELDLLYLQKPNPKKPDSKKTGK